MSPRPPKGPDGAAPKESLRAEPGAALRPLIAVAGRAVAAGRIHGWRSRAVAVPASYIEALHRAGGQEAILSPVSLDPKEAARALASFGGLLLVGGGDIDPALYGEPPRPELFGLDPVADAFEIALARAAAERAVPTLAVCRGIQVLNVAFGGSLDQHLPAGRSVDHGVPGERVARHAVGLQPGSRVAQAMGRDTAECSSEHHQAVDRLGEGLVPVGWAPDGVVEAIELQDGWVVGVQWHPEVAAASDAAQQSLFDALVEAAAAR